MKINTHSIKSGLSRVSRKIIRSSVILLATIAIPFSAQAAGDGVLGWGWLSNYYGSADEACRAQWEWAGMNNGKSRFVGAFDRPDSWSSKDCKWTSWQWLAPQETGCGVFSCGTTLPAFVSFACQPGYTAVAVGRCVKPEDLRPERPPACYNNGGNSNPSTDNPVILSTGSKVLHATDYQSADGKFKITRNYRSVPGGYTTSLKNYPLGLAKGWQFDFNMEIQLGSFSGSLGSSPAGNVTIIAPDGSGYDFVLTSTGEFVPRAASGAESRDYKLSFVGTLPATLSNIYNTSTNWEVKGPDDRKWTLSTFAHPNSSPAKFYIGRPTGIQELDGYNWTLNYNADGSLATIVDSFGRAAAFTWYNFYVTAVTGVANTSPFPEAVRSITFPDGTSVRYQYDPAPSTSAPSTSKIQRLIKVSSHDATAAEVNSTTYLYENSDYPSSVTGIVDHRNIRIATYQYDGLGRAILTKGANDQNQYTIEYGTSGSTITRRVTNPLGHKTVYRFEKVGSSVSDIRLAGIDGEVSPNCPATAAGVSYGPDNFVNQTVDEEGRITKFTRDTSGRPTQIIEGFGTPEARETSIVWHPTWNVPTSIVQPGLTTTRAYNGSGQLVTLTETDTTTHSVPYATNGQSRVWTYTYTTGGLVATVDGPLPGSGDTVSYAYDADGYLQSYTNELGHVTTVLSVNNRGRPTSTRDPNGTILNLEYDALGRLTKTVADPAGINAETKIEYDLTGNISKITNPSGSIIEVTYDGSNRVVGIKNNFDETIAYAYDAMGNNTSQEFRNDTAALVFKGQNAFDELGRLMNVIGVGPATWAYGYDKVGNLTSISDPSSNAKGFAYDSLNRITAFTDERSSVTTSAYGNTAQKTETVDPHGVATLYVRNGWGEAIQEKSNDVGTTVIHRNEKGQITKKIDARSITVDREYDNSGRLLEIRYPGQPSLDVTYTYDSTAGGNLGIGQLTKVTDAAGEISYLYDALGRVVEQVRIAGGQTYTLKIERNKAGAITKVTYPSGRIVTYGRDALGNIENVLTQASISSGTEGLAWWVSYTPFGPRQGLLHGNELVDWRVFNTDGNLVSWLVADEAAPLEYINRAYGYVDNRNLTTVVDNLNPLKNETYWYTPNNFLQNAYGPWGSLTYWIDGAGNITHRIHDDGTSTKTQNFGIPWDSNRVANEQTDGVLTREFTTDAAGNINSENDISKSRTKGYTYNHAGLLAEVKVNSSVEGSYVYDYLSRLTIRTLPGGASSQHFVQDLHGNIIAEYSATGTLQREYIWLDERPLAVIDHSGTTPKTYHVHTDHLGRPVMMTDNSKSKVWEASYLPFGSVASITGPAAFNYRLPGQWFQLESGLHYNWHRHYDPTIGRYLQPDPLGMPDGPNRWAYAQNSPLMFIDPEGLQSGLGKSFDNFVRACALIYNYLTGTPQTPPDPVPEQYKMEPEKPGTTDDGKRGPPPPDPKKPPQIKWPKWPPVRFGPLILMPPGPVCPASQSCGNET